MILLKNLEELSVKIENIGFDEIYIFEEKLSVKFYRNCLYVTCIDEAMKRGKIVERYVVFDRTYTDCIMSLLSNFMIENEIKDIKEFIRYLIKGNLESTDYLDIEKREYKAIKIFSPFREYKNFKRPEKWNLQNVVKGILSGKIRKGKCKMHLTDDYHYDSVTNFSKNKKINLLELCKELVENPSGWRAHESSKDKNIIDVNCFHFDYNELTYDESLNESIIKFDEYEWNEKIVKLDNYRISN